MDRRIALVLAVLVVAASMPVAATARMGVGGGAGVGIGDELRIGAIELFTEMKGDEWLSTRISLCYLPPLMPAEDLALLFTVGARVAYGETVRPFLVVSGGAITERVQFRGFVPSVAWGATAGVEVWVNQTLGFYIATSITIAQRQRPEGTIAYPYLPWTIGFLVSPPTVTAPKVLPLGVEE